MWATQPFRLAAVCAALILVSGLSACAPQAKANAQVNTAQGQAQGEAPAGAAGQAAIDAEALPEDPDALFKYAMDVVENDPERAAMALEGAALQGHGRAAYEMARLQDDAQVAVGWYSMAASAGQPEAQLALGEAYLNGRGTAREPAWAVSWFERAARLDHGPAQHAFGLALLSGVMGPQQPEEALVWLLIARDNGVAQAALPVALLEARLTVTNIKTARERALAWKDGDAGDGAARADTRFAQYALTRLGYEAGLPDGIEGERTRQAVTDFRTQQNLGPGGLDGRTLDLLREKLARIGR